MIGVGLNLPSVVASGRGDPHRMFEVNAMASSLALVRGLGDPTFTRSSDATVEDFEGLIKTVPSNCALPKGARIVENLIVGSSENYENANWVKETDVSVADGNNVTFPAGSAGSKRLRQSLTVAERKDHTYVSSIVFPPSSAWSDSDAVFTLYDATTGGSTTITAKTVETRWRLAFTPTTTGTTTHFILYSDRACVITGLGGAQFEDVTVQADQNPSEYVSVGVGTGPELITNGTFDSDTSGWTADNTGTGTFTWDAAGAASLSYADASNYGGMYQAFTAVVGKSYVLTVTNDGAGTAWLSSWNGIVGGVIAAGSTHTQTFVATNTAITVKLIGSGAGGALIDDVSVKLADHGLGVDGIKAFAYENGNTVDGSGVVTEAQGSAITGIKWDWQPGATNLEPDSDDMSAWGGKTNVTISTGDVDPPGPGFTANKLLATTTAVSNFNDRISGAGSADGNTYSIYIKKGSGATDANIFGIYNRTTPGNVIFVTVNYDTWAITYLTGSSGASIEEIGNGWARLVLSASTGINAGDELSLYACFSGGPHTANEFAYVAGAQFETGLVATAPIPTSGASASRAAATWKYDRAGNVDETDGTLVVEGLVTADAENDAAIVSLSDNILSLLYQSYSGMSSHDGSQAAGAIASITSTAVDVALYNTAEDDDPNWIYGNGQSWHDELGDFPRLALLVLEAGTLTIYDATQADIPSWAVFTAGSSNLSTGNGVFSSASSVAARNGSVYIGNSAGFGAGPIDFIADEIIYYLKKPYKFNGNITQRNSALGFTGPINTNEIVSAAVNDVALTLLSDTPIDSIRKMRTPTVAVATDNDGAGNAGSIIAYDGTVTDVVAHTAANGSHNFTQVNFVGDEVYWGRTYTVDDKTYASLIVTDLAGSHTRAYGNDLGVNNHVDGIAFVGATSVGGSDNEINVIDTDVVGNDNGLTVFRENITTPANGAVAYITSSYNTGWMHGDIKGCWLADTTAETIGVDESTELVTNGTFDSDSGWTYDAAWSVAAGVASHVATAGGAIYRSGSVPADEVVIAQFTISNYSAGSIAVTINGITGNFHAANGTFTEIIRAGSVNTNIGLDPSSSFVGDVDDFSIIRTGNLIENGEFTYNTDGWTAQTSALASVGGGELEITDDGASVNAYARQTIPVVSGDTYVLQVTGRCGTASVVRPILSGAHSWNDSGENNTTTTNKTWFHTFVAETSSLQVDLFSYHAIPDGTKDSFWDNISVRLADPDRSVNDNGLEVHGQITKAAVATGADLMAYSGFSANDYLEQPYNADLDFGTGDFHILLWIKKDAATGIGYLVDRTDPGLTGRFFLYSGSDETLTFRSYDSAGVSNGTVTTTITTPDDAWAQVLVARRSGSLEIYVNNVLDSETAHSGDIDNSGSGTAPLYVGMRNDGINPFTGDLALLRIGAGAPSADDIAAFYADERPLFNANAKCTLPGSSDVVNDLAYNKWRDTLHVGTGGGEAKFSGLLNTEETTGTSTTLVDAAGNTEIVATATAVTLRDDLVEASLSIRPAAGNTINVGLRWSSSTSKFQVGYRDVTGAGSWQWGDEAAFDGAFTVGDWLNLFYSNGYPQSVEKVLLWDKDRGRNFVEARY